MNKNTMKTEGYITNHLSTAPVQLTALIILQWPCIHKAPHHECNNSKEERFPLGLPRTPFCVWMHCCDHLESFTQRKIHTLQGQTSTVMQLSIQGAQNTHLYSISVSQLNSTYTSSKLIQEDIAYWKYCFKTYHYVEKKLNKNRKS